MKRHQNYKMEIYYATYGGYQIKLEIMRGAEICYIYLFKLDASNKPYMKPSANGRILNHNMYMNANLNVSNRVINKAKSFACDMISKGASK